MTTSAGTKFGKTEAGTVWLDPARTSPFRFYQFWLNTDDRDVANTSSSSPGSTAPAIEELERAVVEAPEAREAQRRLAREVTAMVHGAEELARAERASQMLFGGSLKAASPSTIS